MATNAKNCPTDINKQDERQRDNTRIAFAGSPASASASATSASSSVAAATTLSQQKRRQEQCRAKILPELLGIVAQPQEETTQMHKPDVVAADKVQQQQNQQSLMELSQIELIYRAEGNANLVLALPQFKKVLRLPKTSTTSHSSSKSGGTATEYNEMKIGNTQQQTDVKVAEKEWQLHQEHRQQREQQQQQHLGQQQSQEMQSQHQPQQQKQQEVVQSASDPAVNQNAKDLTMEDFVAYIELIRNLLGSEYIFETQIVRISKAEDIRWINERIRADRPAHRRDKEFCGEFGLLLPDATRLPIAFDILLSNLQTELIGETYAVEIKPKQGWPLPADVVVNDLFDLKRKPTRGEPTAAASASTLVEEITNAAPADRSHIIRCRYCAMQFLKLRSGKINRRSSYCPLALFSGDPSQMRAAIDALLQCPQNNLRIFRNGILIYDGEKHNYEELVANIFPGSQIELLKDLLVACLLRDYTAYSNNNSNSQSISNIITVDDTIDVVEVAKAAAAAGQPHLSATSAPRASGGAAETMESFAVQEKQQQRQQQQHQHQKKKNKETMMNESSAVATRQPTQTHTGAEVISETTPRTTTTEPSTKETTTPTSTSPSTTKTDTVAPETTSQAQITEVETLCLPKNCVLEKILHLQLLAKHNMSALHAVGYTHKSENSYNALKSLLQRRSCNQQQQQQQQPIGNEFEAVEAYLLGATALDCSIMLAFHEISMRNQEPPPPPPLSPELTSSSSSSSLPDVLSKHCVALPRYGRSFLTKVTLLDLDPKPDSHLCKYIKQTCQALNLFMEGRAA